MHKRAKRTALYLALALLLVILVPIGTHAMMQSFFSNRGNGVAVDLQEFERLQRYTVLDRMVNVIDALFYKEPDTGAMIDYANHAQLYALEDPATRYINEEEAALLSGGGDSTADVGLLLGWEKENFLLRVRYVQPGSPAEEAGIRAGDYLTTVGEGHYFGYELDLVEAMLRGQSGEEVTVALFRDDMELDYEEMFPEYTLKRAELEPMPRTLGTMVDGQTGVISILEIGEGTAGSFRSEWERLSTEGASWLVLDLREASGGTIEDLLPLAELLLPEGELTTYKDKTGETPYQVAGSTATPPMQVLVSQHTGDMAEVLAGALQARGIATVYGQTTLGTATRQQFFATGEEGAGVYITIGAYSTPAGAEIRGEGIAPDEELEPQQSSWMDPAVGVEGDQALQQVLTAWGPAQEG